MSHFLPPRLFQTLLQMPIQARIRMVPGVLVERGFRFFFLAAGLQAVVALSIWIATLAMSSSFPFIAAFSTSSAWHAHEMLFGFASAVMAGFLLTAVPNWTGTAPDTGRSIVILAGLWLAGRVAVWNSAILPAGLVAMIDLTFLPVLAARIGPPIFFRQQWRNSVFPLLLSVLWASQGLGHAGRIYDPALTVIGHHLAVTALVMMIILMGGRIVPSFTGNYLGSGVRMAPRWVDNSVYVFSALGLGADLLSLPLFETVAGLAAAVAAILHAIRLSGWRTLSILREPILWVLHLGYAWLVIAFALKAAALLTPWVAPTAALHAFTTGAIGTMTLAVMTRAALGHSGRPLVASRLTILIYSLVVASGVTRVAAPHLSVLADVATWMAGVLWVMAYALFVVQFLPLLTRLRIAS